MAAQAGWYVDPRDARQYRYWDGERWSQSTQPIPEVADVATGEATGSLSSGGSADPFGASAFDTTTAPATGGGQEDGLADFMWTQGFGENGGENAGSGSSMFTPEGASASSPAPSPVTPTPTPTPTPVVHDVAAAEPAAVADAEAAAWGQPQSAEAATTPFAPTAPAGGGSSLFSPPPSAAGAESFAPQPTPLFGANSAAAAAAGNGSSVAPAAPTPPTPVAPDAPVAGGGPAFSGSSAPADPTGGGAFTPPAPPTDLFQPLDAAGATAGGPFGGGGAVVPPSAPEASQAGGQQGRGRRKKKADLWKSEAVPPVDPTKMPVINQPEIQMPPRPAVDLTAARAESGSAGGDAPKPPAPGSVGKMTVTSGKKSKVPVLLGILAVVVLGAGAFLFFSGGDDDTGDADVAGTTVEKVTTTAAKPATTAARPTTTVAAAAETTVAAPTTTVAGSPTTLDAAAAAGLLQGFEAEATRACDVIKADPGLLTEAVIKYNDAWAAIPKTYEDLQKSVNDCTFQARDEALKRVAAADAAKG